MCYIHFHIMLWVVEGVVQVEGAVVAKPKSE